MWPPDTGSKGLIRNVQVSVLPCEQAGLRRRLVTGGDRAGTAHLEVHGRRKYETHSWGVRELHWHTADEWAIMLYGTARITALRQQETR
jgi:hypothetical protein